MPGNIVPKCWSTPPSYPEAVSLAYRKKEGPKLNPLEDFCTKDFCTKEYEPSSLCYSFLSLWNSGSIQTYQEHARGDICISTIYSVELLSTGSGAASPVFRSHIYFSLSVGFGEAI